MKQNREKVGVRLKVGREFGDHFVQDGGWGEEIRQNRGENPDHDTRVQGSAPTDPGKYCIHSIYCND